MSAVQPLLPSGSTHSPSQRPTSVEGEITKETTNVFQEITKSLFDWFSFLCRWILSIFFLGTVVSIKNESEEPLNLYIKTKFSNAVGFGDWTWHLYQKGWTLIPEKARYFRTDPHRRNTFMLPFCTCLIVLGTEANFTYFLVYDARAPGERFATIWTARHTFIPRFVRVTRNLEVITKLSCGQANASKPPMTEAFKPSGYFKAVPNLAVLPRVMLPPGSRIVIGPSLELPKAEEDEQKSSIFSFAVAGRVADLVNEISALIELCQIDNLNRLPFGIYLFIQIQIWNSLKNLKSPLPQGKYGSDNFWLSRDYDASSAFHLQTGAGGLQAILVLVVSQPKSGAQLLSVLLAFANLVMAATAVCSHISERGLKYITNSSIDRSKKYLMIFYPCVFLLALPVCFLVGYEYYAEVSSIVSYIVVSIVIVVMHMQQIRNTQQLDAALKGVTPALLFSMVKRVVISIGQFMSKFSVESFVIFLTIGSVALNATILFAVKERSL